MSALLFYVFLMLNLEHRSFSTRGSFTICFFLCYLSVRSCGYVFCVCVFFVVYRLFFVLAALRRQLQRWTPVFAGGLGRTGGGAMCTVHANTFV